MTQKLFITGRSCRLPGAPNVAALAEVLFSNRDTVSEIPRNRWLHEYFLHPVPGTKGKTYSFAAGVVDEIWQFNPEVFGITPREAGQMDPQQRLLLHVTWEALEDAGIVPQSLAGKKVGVFVGSSALAYAARLSQDASVTDAYLMTGNTLALVSNRISHALDLRGPSLTVDTACSSSLFALKLAEDALLSGEIDTAIVAGVNALLDPTPFVGFSAARMLSPKGRCQPFSANADGYVRAEGAVALVLERRSRKSLGLRQPYAALAAVETNSDGRTVNVALPSTEGQAALLRRVYDRAGVDPDEVLFVEAHGTGTLAGDPVEAAALGQVLGQRRSTPLPIGSIKSNIGHLEPASGAAGLLKALLALEKGEFPASLHAETLNPAIEFDALNLSVARKNLPLPKGTGRRFAGVSSFGFGGANAHAILEAVEPLPPRPARRAASALPVLRLSAFSAESLQRSAAGYRRLLGADTAPEAIAGICAEAAQFRGLYPHRAAVLCDSPEAAMAALRAVEAGASDPRVLRGQSDLVDAPAVFVFAGNGSQYAGMGLAALAADTHYARAMRRIDRAYRRIAGWSIIDTLRHPDLETMLQDCEVSQPLLFADQMALVAALAARGLKPAAVMGHSGGEVAAACASGALSLHDALHLNHQRSLALQHLRGRGTMAAVQAPAAQVADALAEFGGGIEIAAVNSPKSVTLVGEREPLTAFLRHVRRTRRWAAVPLSIDYPYHGSAIDEVTGPLHATLKALAPQATQVPFVSSVTGGLCDGTTLDADYWRANARQPVAYAAAVETLKGMGFKAFLEIGAAPVLGKYTEDCLQGVAGSVVLPSFDMRDTAAVNPVARVLARAVANGLRVDLAQLVAAPRRHSRELPHYGWTGAEIRIDRTPMVLNRYGNDADCHPLLGREEGLGAGVWLSEIDQHVAPQFADHRVAGKVVVPGTALAEMALAAARASLGSDHVEIRDADILVPVLLSRSAIYELHTRVAPDQASVRISGRRRGAEGGVRLHLSARYYRASADRPAAIAPDPAVCDADRDSARVYAAARRVGLDYGPGFARVDRLRRCDDGTIELFLREAATVGGESSATLLDVIGADASFHGLIAALDGTELAHDGMGFVPIRIGRLALFAPYAKVASARVRLDRVGQRSVLASFWLFDATGEAIALLEGVRFHAMRLVRDASLVHHAYRQIAVAHTPAGVATPALDPQDLRSIADATGFARADTAHYLIEATAQAIVVEALRKRADADQIVSLRDTADAPYLAQLLGIALRAQMVALTPDGWSLTDAAAESSPEPLLQTLRRDYPALVGETALLAHLRATLPGLLSRRDGLPTASQHFGREALSNLLDGSVFERWQVAALIEAVRRLAADWPAGQVLRIAELCDGAPRLLPRLLAELPSERAEFFALVAPTVDEAGAAAQLPLDRVTTIAANPETVQAAGHFDIVLSLGMLNRSKHAEALLALLGTALGGHGQLLATEAAPSDFSDLVFGLDPEWFVAGATPYEPVSRRYTDDDLVSISRRAGLTEPKVVMLAEDCAAVSLLIAHAPLREVPEVARDADAAAAVAGLLAGDPGPAGTEHAGAMLRVLRSDGAVPRLWLLFAPSQGSEDPVARMSARLLALKDLVAEAKAEQRRVVALVPGGSGQGAPLNDPGQSGIWAVLRTVANEHAGLSVVSYDVDPALAPAEAAARIAALEAGPTRETELVLTGSDDAALRIVHGLGPAHLGPRAETLRQRLVAPASGRLDDLLWLSEPRLAPAAGEVEIAVAATGLNYRDVMWAMGLLPEEALENGFAGPTLGIECAGTVVRCGPGVARLQPGDRVLAFGPGSFASHLVVREDMATLLPEGLDLQAATTLPVAFFTAWYALVTLADLQPGATVLIHGGAGGVGLAAIEIARHRGARIIATAGSPVKRSFLRELGVADVLDSRNLDFAEAVLALTGGRGVDVVLNSLAGEAMERSLNLLAPFGHFLELGKQDFYANTAIGLRPLKKNIAYHGIDVDELMAARPDRARAVFAEVMTAFRNGGFSALPLRGFDAGDTVNAFRLMQKSGHIGKIVVTPPGAQTAASAGPQPSRIAPDAVGWHLIVGGLGGLGIEIAAWQIDGGARAVALVGRRGEPSPEAAQRIAAWRADGVDVALVACDVADATALEAALTALRARRPLASVVHSAMVLDDMPLAALGAEVLARTLPAKIAGAANLDRLTRGDPIVHFVLFSSIATLIGNHGQAAYVAANGYLEGLARKRRAEGLPGLAIGWGPISDVGYLAREKDKAALMQRMSGNIEFSSLQLTRALDQVLQQGRAADPVVHVSTMSWNAAAATLKTVSAPSHQLLKALGRRSEVDMGDEDLRALLIGLPAAKAEEKLTAYLVEKIAHILQVGEKAVSVGKPMNELGIDSLMGVELALTLQDGLGEDIPVTSVSEALSIAEVARRIIAHLHGETGASVEGDDARLVMQHMGIATEPAADALADEAAE